MLDDEHEHEGEDESTTTESIQIVQNLTNAATTMINSVFTPTTG